MDEDTLVLRSTGEGAADDHSLDVARAFVDLAYAHVAIDALDGKIGDVAIATVNLDGRRADALGHLGCEELGHRRFDKTRLTRVAQRCRVPYHLACDLDLGR